MLIDSLKDAYNNGQMNGIGMLTNGAVFTTGNIAKKYLESTSLPQESLIPVRDFVTYCDPSDPNQDTIIFKYENNLGTLFNAMLKSINAFNSDNPYECLLSAYLTAAFAEVAENRVDSMEVAMSVSSLEKVIELAKELPDFENKYNFCTLFGAVAHFLEGALTFEDQILNPLFE
ncbi:MAG: hypothetical protein LBN34_07610 [Clostridiales Family XIII bacterium]|jgi:hypothetical protein|nr:hypothetical protein [Clostridiales Family XIII bacterium]